MYSAVATTFSPSPVLPQSKQEDRRELWPRPLDLPGKQQVFMWRHWTDDLSCVDRDEL